MHTTERVVPGACTWHAEGPWFNEWHLQSAVVGWKLVGAWKAVASRDHLAGLVQYIRQISVSAFSGWSLFQEEQNTLLPSRALRRRLPRSHGARRPHYMCLWWSSSLPQSQFVCATQWVRLVGRCKAFQRSHSLGKDKPTGGWWPAFLPTCSQTCHILKIEFQTSLGYELCVLASLVLLVGALISSASLLFISSL